MIADGCVVEGNNTTPLIKIDLKAEDGDCVLPIFCDQLGLDRSILKHYDYGTKITRLAFHSEEMVDDLRGFGVVPRKTFKVRWIYNIKSDLVNHFIRGYFDGDGCITYNGISPAVKIVGTKHFLVGMLYCISKAIDINEDRKLSKRHKNRKNNIRTLEIGGRLQVKRFCDFIYADATVFLTRKRKRFDELTI
jgi:hypothetical protein